MIKVLTGQVPRLTLVEISFSNSSCTEGSIEDFLCEVTSDDLFICGVEPETWRQIQRLIMIMIIISFVNHNRLFHHQIIDWLILKQTTKQNKLNLFYKKQICVCVCVWVLYLMRMWKREEEEGSEKEKGIGIHS